MPGIIKKEPTTPTQMAPHSKNTSMGPKLSPIWRLGPSPNPSSHTVLWGEASARASSKSWQTWEIPGLNRGKRWVKTVLFWSTAGETPWSCTWDHVTPVNLTKNTSSNRSRIRNKSMYPTENGGQYCNYEAHKHSTEDWLVVSVGGDLLCQANPKVIIAFKGNSLGVLASDMIH